jgi:uncharacterized protein YecE (DUF72 family)
MTALNNIRLGTAGWSYREWIGPFYKKGETRMLRAHSRVFKTVEINSTFYAYPSKGTVMGWVRYSPEDYVFSVKLPKLITHEKMLNLEAGAEADLYRFCDLIRPMLLNGKLGCVLIQLPPKYAFDRDHLERFFGILPAEFRFAVEFRNLSWVRDETWALLKKYGVAYTVVDEPLLPPDVRVTADFAYFRWHGHGSRPWFNYRYTPEELQPWVPKVCEAAKSAKTVYGYFNNHFHGYAVENCLQVLEMLRALTPQQAEAKITVERYFKRAAKIRKPTLEAFIEHREATRENLLAAFMDSTRLLRARRIKDGDVKIQEATDNQVKAVIRGYHVVIDLHNRTVQHDCADWSRMFPHKRFCKHIGKLLLTLGEKQAIDILKQLSAEKDAWEFMPYTH